MTDIKKPESKGLKHTTRGSKIPNRDPIGVPFTPTRPGSKHTTRGSKIPNTDPIVMSFTPTRPGR
ncbi:hypothetical protein Taro_010078 [Colocasia esculenta]|uniref:Uncharacterized protein n=1 Tax=Colocasia esculenta TaxID=4460 RepID=A0A843U6N3_COLES|nr:hypothetical protein [Colocasia esculenta]